ncbi:MAG: ABC transporter permease [Prevotellaceae bacterium]|jgi:putative ABC transport system permease protein|nr:ABC transporter permease [Prevotellaceae bacterium]
MKQLRLIKQSLRFYRAYYRLIALATTITVAVVTGSLMVGESVRATLVGRVHERLGDVETILSGRYSFFDSKLAKSSFFEGKAKAVLLSNGFVPNAGRLIPVQVWGMDDKAIPAGGALVNKALKAELSLPDGEDLVLRLPATGMATPGSLFVTSRYTTEARLTLRGTLAPDEGGNINLKNEQIIPYNLFLNRAALASILEVEGKANLLLAAKNFSAAELDSVWSHELAGVRVHEQNGFTEITSDRVFIPSEAVETLCRNNPGANRLFSYLANSMQTAGGNIPYSFVTAMDEYKGKPLDDEVILSDYAARRLNAAPGDSICITYYYATGNLKTLYVDTLRTRVAAVAPLEELVADKGLSADFPGLSDVDRCTEWDSDLPIDMSLITDDDEDYWSRYRATPKAILPYKAIQSRWSNAYGSATAVRFAAPPDVGGLNPAMFGMQLIHPREAGFDAARKSVDFASLFMSLGFFIILSAMLLLLTPLSEMIHRRRDEIALLYALGYTQRRIVRLLRSEAAPAALAASFAGIAAGMLYTWLILVLLGSLWKGATHTGGFILFPGWTAIAAGWLAGTAASLLTVSVGVRRIVARLDRKREKAVAHSRRRSLRLAWTGAGLTTIVLCMGIHAHATGYFMLTGLLMLCTAAFAGDCRMLSCGAPDAPFGESKWIWGGLLANRRRVWLSFFTLATGVFLVFAVGLNRKSFSDGAQLSSATGGYTLWCETTIPVYRNLSTPEGRSKLALTGLPPATEILQLARYSADDAGCLNLNRVSQPSVLGVDMQTLESSDFRLLKALSPEDFGAFASFRKTVADRLYPVLIDEAVLTWSLMRKLGDTIHYDAGNRTVSLLLAGALDNTVFQGNLLMDVNLFTEIWGEAAGSEIILLKIGEQETAATKRLMEQALHEYGVRVSTTDGRLQEFNSVTDTYLTIFLTLGGLGLLLGVASFIVVLRKDLLSRREQIKLCRAMGFPTRRISSLLIAESRIVPLYAIGVGVMGALAGVSAGVASLSMGIAFLSFVLAAGLMACMAVFIYKCVRREVG